MLLRPGKQRKHPRREYAECPCSGRKLPRVTDGPLCVFCGSEFPVELERGPTCSRPWIDQRLAEVADGAVVPLVDVAGDVDPPIDSEPARRVPLWMIAGGVALVALATYGIVFSFLLGGDEPVDAAAGVTTTTEATVAAPTPTTAVTPTTSSPPSVATTTAAPTTTSTTSTTTTTTTLPPLAEGTPIPIDDVALMGAFSFGPLRVGSNGTTAIERLAGTFGQPTEIAQLSGGDAGICDTEVGRLVRFGWVGAIVVGEPGSETFVGYVYGAGPSGHVSEGLATLSGARVGNTVTEVDTLYAGSVVQVADVDGQPHLFILRSSDRRTLLWGPLSGPGDDAVLLGINAPYWCDDGPFVP